MLDKYTTDMLFEEIYNVYSDKEQLDIIRHLVELLKSSQEVYMEKDSIEELYTKGLNKILDDIKDLQKEEKEFWKNKESDK